MRTKVAVILPSRGLIFSKTAEEILKNVQGVPHRFFFSHKLPIPDCFEWPTQKALKDEEITHFWFVEDDMILPDDILRRMLIEETDVVTCDYPVTNDGRGAVFQASDGEIVFGGTGCLLVKRHVIEKLRAPIFRTDIKWIPSNHAGGQVKLSAVKGQPKKGDYGMHDVNLYMKMHEVGAEMSLRPEKLGQRKLVKLGVSGSNDGAHQIEEWHDFEPNWWLKFVGKLEQQPQDLLYTITVDGTNIRTSRDHAEALVKAKKGTFAPEKALVIDYGELEL